MFEDYIHKSRATVLIPSSSADPSISDLLAQARTSWLPPTFPPDTDLYRMGIAAYHELTRLAHRPAAWGRSYRVATDSINSAASYDQTFVSSIFSELVPVLAQALASVESVRAKISESENAASPHRAANILCEAYHDLFEGVLPFLAKPLIQLKSARAPARRSATSLNEKTARELYEQLASGQGWSVLAPFDPEYRNQIAHRSATISTSGTVMMPRNNGLVRHISAMHLKEIVNDAMTTVESFIAALELSPHRPEIEFTPENVLAMELVGFACAHLEQQVANWEPKKGGLVKFSLRGPRCDEVKLLKALASAFRAVKPYPPAIFIQFLNRAGKYRGSWTLKPELLASVGAPIERLKRTIGNSKCVQFRLERPYKKI